MTYAIKKPHICQNTKLYYKSHTINGKKKKSMNILSFKSTKNFLKNNSGMNILLCARIPRFCKESYLSWRHLKFNSTFSEI